MFEEDDDEQMNGTGNIDIELEDGIDINELNGFYGEDQDASSEVQQHSNLRIVETRHDNYNDQQPLDILNKNNNERMITEQIISEYTGEMSSIDYLATQNDQSNDSARDNENLLATTGEQFGEPIDMDNYVSPCPGTSSSQAMIPPLARTDVTASKNLSACGGNSMNRSSILKQQPPNKSSDTHSLPQLQHPSRNDVSAPTKTIAKKAAVRQDQVHTLQPTVPPIAPANYQTASSRADVAASAAAKEKRIEVIRQRMESCLTAINNKVTEKGHRSPHAPFLAYLGTKLPNVPNEILPDLEKEILQLVDLHSQ